MGLAVFHHHPITGLPCDCPYGRPKFLKHQPRLAGVNWNRALKTQVPGKKFQSLPGSERFVGFMRELLDPALGGRDPEGWRDEIVPFLVKEFRAGRISFNEDGQALFHVAPGLSTRLTVGVVDRWGRWAAARQHPTRRGINITGPDVTVAEVRHASDEFFRDMAEREARQDEIEQMQDSTAPAVYHYNDGWTVRDLAQSSNPSIEMELEGSVMDHCIGNDGDHPHPGYDYKDAVADGVIPHVYSLRDPDGLPHVTFHFNDDGTLAEMHARSNHDGALRKYAPRVAHFLRERHPDTLQSGADHFTPEDMEDGRYPWLLAGNQFEARQRYQNEYAVRGPDSMESLEAWHIRQEDPSYENIDGLVDDEYWDALQNDHEPELYWQDPDWYDIAGDMALAWRSGEADEVNRFINWMNEQNSRWFDHVRQSLAARDPNASEPLSAEFAIRDREQQLERRVHETWPDVKDPKRLFQALPPDREWSEEKQDDVPVWTEDSYAYPLTDAESLGLGEDQYLNPSDKAYFTERHHNTQIRDMRARGATWDEIARQHPGAAGYNHPESPARRAFERARTQEHGETARTRRHFAEFEQNQQYETDGTRLPLDQLGNQVRRQHWEALIRHGLTPDQASMRIIEYEQHMRNNPQYCQTCGDYGGLHYVGCPQHPDYPHGQPESLPGPPGTFSRAAAWEDDFMEGMSKIPGVRQINSIPNRSIEHNVGDRVTCDYPSPIEAPDPQDPNHPFHGMCANTGTVVQKFPTGQHGPEPAYEIRWDLGADWNGPRDKSPYFTPGRLSYPEYPVAQSRLWPEGHEALNHAVTDPKDPKSLDLLYPPEGWSRDSAWLDAPAEHGQAWSAD